jgi:hypothetical protein
MGGKRLPLRYFFYLRIVSLAADFKRNKRTGVWVGGKGFIYIKVWFTPIVIHSLKRPVHSQLNRAILLCDFITEEKTE